jgi:probable F420-dependent oxidoreductase
MRIGVVFPQTEISPDPIVVRDYAQAAEDLGFTHLVTYDHVIGADLANRPDWRGPYNLHSLFHEPFVLFGYLAGLTKTLEFVTGILILPQRQTVLVAKQAAEVDVLSGGRFRLGVGIGWNPVEYQALNEDFRNRGRREEEQIEVLRALFTQESVTFNGRWHHIDAAGINPLPVQRPIPIWLGGSSEAALRRVVKMGDGWLPQMPPGGTGEQLMADLRRYAEEAGRDFSSIGIEARISIGDKTPDQWRREMEGWQKLGAGYISINTMKAGVDSPRGHIDKIREIARELGVGS